VLDLVCQPALVELPGGNVLSGLLHAPPHTRSHLPAPSAARTREAINEDTIMYFYALLKSTSANTYCSRPGAVNCYTTSPGSLDPTFARGIGEAASAHPNNKLLSEMLA
jgi:hypothetical protein